MKKYAFLKVDSQEFLSDLIVLVKDHDFYGQLADKPEDILYFNTVEEPMALLAFLQTYGDSSSQLLVVAEVEVSGND